jgi:uncharacterized membrane protein
MGDDRRPLMSTFKRYVVIQLVTLVCGIVGPIFLFVYFAAQPDPTLKWMYWFGLFITAADVLIALAITSATAQSESKLTRKRQRFNPGTR